MSAEKVKKTKRKKSKNTKNDGTFCFKTFSFFMRRFVEKDDFDIIFLKKLINYI